MNNRRKNVIAYKLFKKYKNGTLHSLFINKKEVIILNKWIKSSFHPTKGYITRPAWHTVSKPQAPHLSTKNRIWCKVEIKDYTKLIRPKSQGGVWYLANKMKVIKEL